MDGPHAVLARQIYSQLSTRSLRQMLCGSLVHILKFESCKPCEKTKLKARFIGKKLRV